MKTTSALLALGVCLAMFAPSARADDSKIYVDWKFGNKNDFTFNNGDGYVWNGAFRDAVIAAMEAGDYAAFQALTNGFNELAEIQGTKGIRYKTGCTCNPKFEGSFTNAQDFVTFLYFTGTGNGSKSWNGNNFPTYSIFEKSTEGKQYDPPKTENLQVNAREDKDSFTSGTVGAACTNGATLLIATDPVKLPRAGFTPAGMTNGLTSSNGTVVCTAPETIVFDGVHYTATGKVGLQTWNGTAWSEPQEVDAPAENGTNTYTYTHEAASARLTWKYAADGFRPDIGFLPAGYGFVTIGTEPNFEGLTAEGYYTNGTQLALTAVPADAGFRFVKWVVNGENAGSDTMCTVTMDQPRTVRAVFESIPLTWNGGDGDNGSWTNGGAGWLAADGTPTNWLNGATAVFTNPAAVTADIAAEGVTVTAARFEGAAVELTGGTLTMINDAWLSVPSAARLTINATLAGTDGLRLANGIPVHEGFLTKQNTLLFSDVSVAEIEVFTAQMGGSGIGTPPLVAGAYNVKRDENDGTVSVQFQVLQNGNLKCVKAVFSDGVDGIYAKAEWAKWIEEKDSPPALGYDFETDSDNKIKDRDLATGPGKKGYGLFNLAVTVAGEHGPLVIGKPTVFTGDLALDAGRLEFGEEGKLGADGKFADAVTLAAGTVLATPPCKQTFNGQISGQGMVLVQNAEGVATSSVSFADAQWTGGLTVGTNGFVETPKKKCTGLPTAGEIEVVDGGEIKLNCEGPGIPNAIYVRDGGILNIAHYTAIRGGWSDSGKRKLYMENNGFLKLTGDSDPMIYFLEVTNGGIIEGDEGRKILLGNIDKDMTLNVKGNAPLLQKAGYCYISIPKTFTMDVEDVTGSEAGDMIVSGPITGDAHYTVVDKKTGVVTDFGSRKMIKTGAGTVVFSGANTYSNCITRIDEGTLRFETDHAMGIGTNTDTRIVLNGDGAEGKICVLDIGTNVNEVCALGLEQKGGTLKLGEGGSIEFAASGALDWTEDAELNIVGELGKETVRFGTDTNGLTTVQLDKIKLNGEIKPFHLDAAGWLCGAPVPPAGTVILLR